MDTLSMLKAFMVMTDMTTSKDEDIKSKLATKQRMVFATMRSVNPYWEQPSDWDTITDEEKLERLERIQSEIL